MKFLVYKDKKDEWRWTLYADNGEEIAVSSEGYTRKMACLNSICIVSNSDNAEVEVETEL